MIGSSQLDGSTGVCVPASVVCPCPPVDEVCGERHNRHPPLVARARLGGFDSSACALLNIGGEGGAYTSSHEFTHSWTPATPQRRAYAQSLELWASRSRAPIHCVADPSRIPTLNDATGPVVVDSDMLCLHPDTAAAPITCARPIPPEGEEPRSHGVGSFPLTSRLCPPCPNYVVS